MPENLNQSFGRVIASKFSSDSVKTISDAKISSNAKWNETSRQDLPQEVKSSDENHGKQKLHNRCCKARRYRKNKFYKCKNKGFGHHSHAARSSAIRAKICKTSPSLQQATEELGSAANIKSVSNSDGENCTIKSSDRWKFKKVLNKLTCFSTKVAPDSNLSKIKIWNSCAGKVGSSLSTHFNLSSHSWSGKKLIKKLSWRKQGSQSVPNAADPVTDHSSKSLNEGHTDISDCTSCANETDDDFKNKEVRTVHPIQEVQSSKNLKSVEYMKSCELTQHETRNNSQQKNSDKSVDVTIINLEDNNNSSYESTETSSTSRRHFSAGPHNLRQPKSAPALIKNPPCINVSFVEAPVLKESPKVTIVVDKICQAQMSQTSQTSIVGKVSTSTSCANLEITRKFCDKEIQNEMNSFQAVNTSVNKMCQTSFSMENTSNKKKEQVFEKICCAETCKEALNEVSQLASKLLEVTNSDKKSETGTVCKDSSDHLSKCQEVDEKDPSTPKQSVSSTKDSPSKCRCSEDCRCCKDEPKWRSNKGCEEPILGKCLANQKFLSNLDFPGHSQGNRVILVAEGGHSCPQNSLMCPHAVNQDSNVEGKSQKACHSVGFIQQPSALKSSSSFLKVNFSRALDDTSPNQPNCHACNIHKNPDVWKTKDSCFFDFPFTRSNFLKLYPEPYINHLSNDLSNVQLIFHKKDKNQKQMYVCQECKKNASRNRHARKHHYSPNWRKSTTSCGSALSCNVINCPSSGDNLGKQSMASCIYHHPKPKKVLKGKMRLQSNPKYENFKTYGASRHKISKNEREHCCQSAPDNHFSSSASLREFNPSNSHQNFDKDGFRHFPAPPPPPSSSQQTATEVLLPPPPPPLYEYPPYLYDPDKPREKHNQNKQTSVNKRNKSPDYAKSAGNGKQKSSPVARHQYSTRHEVSPLRQRKSSPSFTLCHRSKKYQSPKRILSSDSDVSNIIVTSTNKRYEKEKKVAGYFSYNKPSNYLLKYPGFGDCIPPQPAVKLKPKPSTTTRQGTKARKKIRDKYKRNGTSVRCLIRNALTSEGNNCHEKKTVSPEKFKHSPAKDLPKIESRTKITTLFENAHNDYSSNLNRDRTNLTVDDRKPTGKNRKTGGKQTSKNTFCALSDSALTSDSMIKISCSPELKTKRHGKIFRSESMQWPRSPIPLRDQKIMKRYSEELIRTPTMSTNRRFVCPEKDKTQEIFTSTKAKTFSANTPSENQADSSTSNESIAEYFRILDVIAEKRRQFKKEEKRRQRIQELTQKQTKHC